MTALAQGSAGLALVMCFALLGARQVSAAVVLLGVQSLAVATSAVALHQAPLAAVTVAANAAAATLFLRRQMAGFDVAAPPWGGAKLGILAGAALAALSQTQAAIAEPLAVVLLSVLLAATRRHSLMHLVALVSLQNGLALAAAAADIPLPTALPGFLIAIPLGLALSADHSRTVLLRNVRVTTAFGWGSVGCAVCLLAASLMIPLDSMGATFAPLVAAWGLAVAWSHRARRRSWPARLADLLQLVALLAAVCIRSPIGALLALFIAMAATILPAARRRLDGLVLGSCAAGLALFGMLIMPAGQPLIASTALLGGLAMMIAVAPGLASVALVLVLRLSVQDFWPSEAASMLTGVAITGVLCCALALLFGPRRHRITLTLLSQAALIGLAVGLADPQGRFAAAVMLILLIVTDSAVVLARTGAAAGMATVAAKAGLAGIPPFGMFPGLVLLALAVAGVAPWLLLPVSVGVAAMVIAGTPHRLPASGGMGPPSLAWAPLGLALAFSYATPESLVSWLASLTAGAP